MSMYDLYCDVTSMSFQMSDGNVFKMVASLPVFTCESLTILEFCPTLIYRNI